MGIKRSNEKLDYDFTCINLTDYKLTFTLKIGSRMMKYIFSKAREEVLKRNIKNLDENKLPKEITLDTFEIPIRFLKLIKTSMSSSIKDVKQQVAEDKIEIKSVDIKKGIYKKVNDVWYIDMIYEGAYVDGR